MDLVRAKMTDKKPVSPRDLEEGSPPSDTLGLAERVTNKVRSAKADLLLDPDFAGELLRQTIEGPSNFPHDTGAGMGALIKRHSMQGRTNHMKVHLYVSDADLAQLTAYKELRGDRAVNDIINELLCRALAALRTL
jgi:hypothetical protein